MSERTRAFIIDGSSFLYRALYALKPMHTLQGVSVGAVYGFCRILKKLLHQWSPEYVIIAWDSKGLTERHELLAEYKGQRDAAPQELHDQKELIQKFADQLGISQIAQSGIEADDIMYSLALDFVAQGIDVVLVTNDKDLGQIVGDHITLYDVFKDVMIDRHAIIAKYGVPPEKLTFYFGLVGDASDNIPGVKGIGPKGAQKLVDKFSSMDNMYAHLDQIEEKVRKKLIEHRSSALLSEKLFTLRQYTMPLDLLQCKFEQSQWQRALPFFTDLNFTSLMKELSSQPKVYVPFSLRYQVDFRLIVTEDALRSLCEKIRARGTCALDTEIVGKDVLQSKLVGISCAVDVGEAFYIPVAHHDGNNIAGEYINRYLKPIFEDDSIVKYLQNAKFDAQVLFHYGIQLNNVVFDTMIAAGLIARDDERIGLKFLSQRYLQQEMISFPDFIALHHTENIAQVSAQATVEYAAADAHQTLQLVPILQQKLQDNAQQGLFNDIEMPLVAILQDMEREGIILDVQRLDMIQTRVTKELQALHEVIINLVGDTATSINFNSSQQVAKLLFTDLKLVPIKSTNSKSRHSTDKEVLQELARTHPVPALIVKYRELSKLKNTYLDALPEYVNPATQRIHTTFSQVSTATGRLASSEPNMQNIPVESGVSVSVRSAFQAPPGMVFLSADYSQIELRVLAYLSQDKNLVAAFLHDQDVHAITASRLFNVDVSEVLHEQRQLGKRINFSILYGLTPYGLSKDLSISVALAKDYIDTYRAQFPGVQTWSESVIEQTQKQGYVTTWLGRRRYLPGIYERNRHLFDLACRVAINTKAQGTAAEIVKLGMIRCAELLKKNNNRARLVLQIHDELLITVPESQAVELQEAVRHALESVVDWNVPLKVTTRTGVNWGEVTK